MKIPSLRIFFNFGLMAFSLPDRSSSTYSLKVLSFKMNEGLQFLSRLALTLKYGDKTKPFMAFIFNKAHVYLEALKNLSNKKELSLSSCGHAL